MCNKGFTLLEIIIAVAIIGLVAVIVIPNFMGRTPYYERKETIAKLNALTQLAWQNALIENKIHKIKFDFNAGKVSLEVETDEKGEQEFKPLVRTHLDTEFAWPDHFEVKQFLIEKRDAMKEYMGGESRVMWFFVMPDGLTQDVIINFVDVKDLLPDGKARPVGLVLNPFNAQFREYDTFQK